MRNLSKNPRKLHLSCAFQKPENKAGTSMLRRRVGLSRGAELQSMMLPGGSGKLEYNAWDGVQIMMNGLVCHSEEFELYPKCV